MLKSQKCYRFLVNAHFLCDAPYIYLVLLMTFSFIYLITRICDEKRTLSDAHRKCSRVSEDARVKELTVCLACIMIFSCLFGTDSITLQP